MDSLLTPSRARSFGQEIVRSPGTRTNRKSSSPRRTTRVLTTSAGVTPRARRRLGQAAHRPVADQAVGQARGGEGIFRRSRHGPVSPAGAAGRRPGRTGRMTVMPAPHDAAVDDAAVPAAGAPAAGNPAAGNTGDDGPAVPGPPVASPAAASPAAGSPDSAAELAALRDTCTRFLAWHGAGRAADLLATIPPGHGDRPLRRGRRRDRAGERDHAGARPARGRVPAQRHHGPAGGAAGARRPAAAPDRRVPPGLPHRRPRRTRLRAPAPADRPPGGRAGPAAHPGRPGAKWPSRSDRW